jgi:hypothetical protein
MLGTDDRDLERIKHENQRATNRIRSLANWWMVIERREGEIIAQCKMTGKKLSPSTTRPWESIETQ